MTDNLLPRLSKLNLSLYMNKFFRVELINLCALENHLQDIIILVTKWLSFFRVVEGLAGGFLLQPF